MIACGASLEAIERDGIRLESGPDSVCTRPRAHGIDMGGVDSQAFARNPPDHLPSIRQDYNRGRTLELTPLLLAPLAFDRAAGDATPHLDTMAALTRQMAGK